MQLFWGTLFTVAGLLLLEPPATARAQDDAAVPLPSGVKAVWDTARAFRETTPTREKICVNGLWRWQPALPSDSSPPTNNWGYFKVPGPWPGITDYLQKDSQTVYAHPSWRDKPLRDTSAAWYERTLAIPPDWAGRRIALSLDYLNSYAMVFVDGAKRGELQFPGGELDLSTWLKPGGSHRLSLLVVALPLKGVLLSYTDSNSARQLKGSVERRGLCGDLFLVSTPSGPRVTNIKTETSFRRSNISVEIALEGLAPRGHYSVRSVITKQGRLVRPLPSRTLDTNEIASGRVTLSESWRPDDLWDLNTASNKFQISVTLAEADDRNLDVSFPHSFGFREFWIVGRDFYLNGSRIWLSAVPLDNAQVGAAPSTYSSARESLLRLKDIGINFVYTHNYGCQPGSHLGFEEILRAADDVGVLVSLSQPHFSHYEWLTPEADQTNGYALHAAYYTRVAEDHPSVIAYAMSHNATGYEEDMNPSKIDGIQRPVNAWSSKNANLAFRAEAIVKKLDPGRIVYHHASGNLGSMHAINFYPNFAPIQELSDWFEHWAAQGVKPVFTCEYGAPFTWDWTMYRGWFKGKREFGGATVPWEYCLAEWNSQFFGDQAYRPNRQEAEDLRWEAAQFRARKIWHRWDYPHPVGSPSIEAQFPVMALYLQDNWRAFRGWGVSAISPWEYETYWTPRPGLDRRRKPLPVDWDNLQRPGFSPDYLGEQYERMDMAFERSDWVPTEAARALLRNNGPLLAWIAGKPAAFTSKDHIFLPGESLQKQIIVINNSRQTVSCATSWSLGVPTPVTGAKTASLPTGEQERVPIQIQLPPDLKPGHYALSATTRFSTGEVLNDWFPIEVLPSPITSSVPANATPPLPRTALYDPQGKTRELLNRLGWKFQNIETNTSLEPFDLLIVGQKALTTNEPAPDITRVRAGLKVLLFEQTPMVLERRLGFRIAEYGLRQLFPRVPDHPALEGLSTELLSDWRGVATLQRPNMLYTLRPRYGPTIEWAGIQVPHIWRCGNRGNVASVLIEKPAGGDFLPILDGGFSLQYSPLLEYNEGQGMILFCQLDVTGRSETEPAADLLARNILQYAASWKPTPATSTTATTSTAVTYLGEDAGKQHLERAGFSLRDFADGQLPPGGLLVLGPGCGPKLAPHRDTLAAWMQSGGKVLALGLDQSDADALPVVKVKMKHGEHITSLFPPPGLDSPLRGIGPADIRDRDPQKIPLIASGATIIDEDGVLATALDGRVVFCQLVPWNFDPKLQMNLKRTFRKTAFLVSRLLANLGAQPTVPLLDYYNAPLSWRKPEKRFLAGLYLDQPEEWDDPYRFFRW